MVDIAEMVDIASSNTKKILFSLNSIQNYLTCLSTLGLTLRFNKYSIIINKIYYFYWYISICYNDLNAKYFIVGSFNNNLELF